MACRCGAATTACGSRRSCTSGCRSRKKDGSRVIEQFDEQLASDEPGDSDYFERSDLPRVARLGWGQQARLLAFAAAALFFVAAWGPWLVRVYRAGGGGPGKHLYVGGRLNL